MFITFEGIDGCGKSTQLELIKKYLVDKGKDVLSLREPGGTLFSEKIREILLHSDDKLTFQSELFLFEAARADLVSKVILPAMNKGYIILCDRFYDSTTAYQGFGRGLPVPVVEEMNALATNNLKPDFTFYLHVGLEISLQRTIGKQKDKIENSGDGFFSRVVTGFRELCRLEPGRVIEIDAEGSIEETYSKILKFLEDKI